MHSKRVLSGSTSVLPRRALFRGTVRHASPSLYMKYAVIYQSFGSVQQIKLLKRGFTCVASSVAPAKRSRQPGAPRKTSQKAPPCPRPADYQQTLRRSFTLGGIGLHTGDYAYVRVKPACPGEGRYFVRVPEGTNSSLFQLEKPRTLSLEETDINYMPSDDLSEDVRTGLFFEWVKAQEERGYQGTFADYIDELKALEAEEEERQRQESEEDEEAVPRPEGEGEYLPASITMVSEENNMTLVLGEEGQRVIGAELLLAALEACGVDNARIEIEGGYEVPIADGSALGWCIEAQKAGLRPAGATAVAAGDAAEEGEAGEEGEGEGAGADTSARSAAKGEARTAPAPRQPLVVQEGESFIALYPGPRSRLSVGLDQAELAPVIGRQWFSWTPAEEEGHFRWEVAPARTTFPSADEVVEMVQRGGLRGGPDYCALVADGEEWDDDSLVRFVADEPARHAMLDLLGALALGARPGHRGLPEGHVVAFNAGTDLQVRFVQELQRVAAEGEAACPHVPVSW